MRYLSDVTSKKYHDGVRHTGNSKTARHTTGHRKRVELFRKLIEAPSTTICHHGLRYMYHISACAKPLSSNYSVHRNVLFKRNYTHNGKEQDCGCSQGNQPSNRPLKVISSNMNERSRSILTISRSYNRQMLCASQRLAMSYNPALSVIRQ